MPTGPILRLCGIGKHFGRLAVLRGLDLDVHPHEVVGLVGANGAGKSTLLAIIAGLMSPSRGERIFAGSGTGPMAGREARARLALVNHTAQTYPLLTATENLELFARLRHQAGVGAESVAGALDRLGLGYASGRRAGTFSRGMLQRLALARALVGRPELLLLDEPFTALDRPGRALLASVLAAERDRGAGVLLASHDIESLVSVADRVVLLEGGVVAGSAQRADGDGFTELVRGLVAALPTPSSSGAGL